MARTGSTVTGNTITGNHGDGVNFSGGTAVRISGNSIDNNTGLGINLVGGTEDSFGVTSNDGGDIDGIQNFPSPSSATLAGGNLEVQGSFDSAASTTYTIEFFRSHGCDPSGHGEGASLAGSAPVTTDGSGTASFDVTLPATGSGTSVTATATGPGGSTSEFSSCVTFASTGALAGIVAG